MFKMSSMTTNLPRHLIADVSVCQTGAVAVLIPFPMPSIFLALNRYTRKDRKRKFQSRQSWLSKSLTSNNAAHKHLCCAVGSDL